MPLTTTLNQVLVIIMIFKEPEQQSRSFQAWQAVSRLHHHHHYCFDHLEYHHHHDHHKKPEQQSLDSQAWQAVSSEQQILVRLESREAGRSRSDPLPGSPVHHGDDHGHFHDEDDDNGDHDDNGYDGEL